jgi:hypothetical protein
VNINKTIEALEAGLQNPGVALYKTVIEDKFMEQVGVRRRAKQEQHPVWALSIGEAGQQPTAIFYGFHASDCIKKAMAWRGVPKVTRKPRAKASPPQGG